MMESPSFQQLPSTTAQTNVGAEVQQLLSPAQLRALQLLQTPLVSLERELEKEVEQNPLLELKPPKEKPAETDEGGEEQVVPAHQNSWRLEGETGTRGVSNAEAQARRDYFFNSIASQNSVYEELEKQISLTAATSREREILSAIFQHLDNRGFLDVPAETLRKKLRVGKKIFDKMLGIFHSFDPVGVGAENLQDFYLILLERDGHAKTSLVWRLVSQGFSELLAGRLPQLVKQLRTTREELDKAIAVIRAFPLSAISEDVPAQIVEPELIFFKNKNGDWDVRLNDERLPRLRISREYKEMLAQGKIVGNDKVYFEKKMSEANRVIDAVRERGNTILEIGKLIVELQRDYFEKGPVALRPLLMSDLAKRLGLHPTTVTRAVADKYVETPFGIQKMRQFFSNEAGNAVESGGGSNLSQVAIKNMLKSLIASEPRGKPFTDDKLVELLVAKGVQIARRTVVKYRESLGIPSTRVRKNL